MSYNSETSDDGTVISDYFSDHFSSVYNSNVTCHTYDFNVSNSVVIERCDVEETDIYIYNAIFRLNNHLSAGPDRIPVMFLKKCCFILSHILCILFKLSVAKGEYPDQWKVSYVTPVFKSGNRSEITNYRAISRNSILAKISNQLLIAKSNRNFKIY